MTEFNSINQGKNFSLSAIIGIFAVWISTLYDFYVVQFPLGIGYISTLALFSLSVFLLALTSRKAFSLPKVVLTTLCFAILVLLKIYFVAVIYVFFILQIAFVFTSLIILNRKDYIRVNLFLIVGTFIALGFSQVHSPHMVINTKIKIYLIAVYMQMHLFMMFIYYFGIYPKLNKVASDLKFTSIGKSTSFIMHEISKPVDRLSHKNEKYFSKEIEEISEMLSIAQDIRSNKILNAKKEVCNLRDIVEERLNHYQSFLTYFNIKVINEIPDDYIVMAPHKYINIIIDNLIKNAIEASKLVEPVDNRFLGLSIKNTYFTINNPFTVSIELTKMFEPNNSTKIGNMGVGLYLCKHFCEALDWDLRVTHQQLGQFKIFQASLNLKQAPFSNSIIS